MKTYIGTKIIKAEPQSTDQDGYGYRVVYADGYTSWSPKAAFEQAYRPIDEGCMTFGLALEALKLGLRVTRKGWNGKGMWLSLSNPTARRVPASGFWSPNNAEFANSQPGEHAWVLPCITMKTADDKILMGWNATQVDMLAEDWEIVI